MGDAIKTIRVNKGLSIAELSKLSAVPIEIITQYENNVTVPNIHFLCRIAHALETPIDNIIYARIPPVQMDRTPLCKYSIDELLKEIKNRVGD